MGNKASDLSGVHGCANCHSAIDLHWLPKEEELFYLLRGLQRTIDNLYGRGIITIPGQIKQTPKPSAKIMPRRSMVVDMLGRAK